MAFQKAQDLLKLARICASRYYGITVKEIATEFEVNERTAQRMLNALKEVFPSISHTTDDERRRRWKLSEPDMLGMQGIYDFELVAFEMSIWRALREGAHAEAEALKGVRDRFMATLPSTVALRAEVDAAAVLEARGYACRPGPKVKMSPTILNIIAAAIKSPYRLIIWYQGAKDPEPRRRTIEPYGVLLGIRHYLVARDIAKGDDFRQFRLDRINKAEITLDWFAKDKDFNIEEHATQSFGSYHLDSERTQVVWRFTRDGAATAREFVFHPKQKTVEQEDGGLIVSFEACGLVEMAWHLYKWGDAVEVIEPVALRQMVADYRNKHISVLP
jgi:predicted DNA-binding transcriptional regulator YafY